MKIVLFGLTISSSWGNGHATLLRGLFKALAARGHRITFFERDVPYHAAHRDLVESPHLELHLYREWTDIVATARKAVAEADVAVVTSYCPDGIDATNLVAASNVNLRVFYDLDTPVTLEALQNGEEVTYIGPRKLVDFDRAELHRRRCADRAQRSTRRATELERIFDEALSVPALASYSQMAAEA